MDKVIVFGASGQLGQCLKKVCVNQGLDHFIFPDEGIANILDIECLAALFEQFKPGYCINCAAYTDVDKAEDDTETARKINCEGAFNIAALCDKYNIVLLQISTDFVFKGDVPHLLTEKHTPGPINVYGLTKLEAERAVAAATNKYVIIRTS